MIVMKKHQHIAFRLCRKKSRKTPPPLPRHGEETELEIWLWQVFLSIAFALILLTALGVFK